MYLPQNDISEVVLRQRNQKAKLSKELLKNKLKLSQVQRECAFLNQPLNTDYADECERLDDEIDKLRRVCETLLNEIENIKHANREAIEQRQPIRPAPPPPPHPPPRTRPHTLFPKPQSYTSSSPTSPQSPASQRSHTPTSPSQQQMHLEQEQPKQVDDLDASDQCTNEQPWQCSVCTLQNHPLLNKCECCDNVRILPGSVRILPSPHPFASRSAPQPPATPVTTPVSGPMSARVMSVLHRLGVPGSSGERESPQVAGDVII